MKNRKETHQKLRLIDFQEWLIDESPSLYHIQMMHGRKESGIFYLHFFLFSICISFYLYFSFIVLLLFSFLYVVTFLFVSSFISFPSYVYWSFLFLYHYHIFILSTSLSLSFPWKDNDRKDKGQGKRDRDFLHPRNNRSTSYRWRGFVVRI